jgi:DNA polymerase beta
MAAAAAVTTDVDFKEVIVAALETMKQKEVAEKQTFKARAYGKVITQIKGLAAVHSMEDLKEVEGIGEKIRAKLEELFATGGLAAAERAKRAHHLETYDAFLKIYGVGPAKARSLVDSGLDSIAALRAAAAANPKLLTKAQQLGLEHYEDLLERIPRAEMNKHARIIAAAAVACEIPEHAIVGSFRRGAPTSGDIDVLLKSDDPEDLKEFVEGLMDAGYIAGSLAFGEKKFMGLCCAGMRGSRPVRRLDVLLTPPAEFPFALLYFTGSDQFNIQMRKHALTLGYSLNEHGITGIDGKATPSRAFECEGDIFAFLGLQWKTPAERALGAAAVVPVEKI